MNNIIEPLGPIRINLIPLTIPLPEFFKEVESLAARRRTLFAVAIGNDQIVIEGDSKMVMNQVE